MFAYPRRIKGWAEELNRNSEWKRALENAFDTIGFTEKFITEGLRGVVNKHQRNAIKDNVWGMIEIDECSLRLINSPIFQRLRHIRQTGFSFYTYPTAQHTRFEHSLGVYHVINCLLEEFRMNADKKPPLDNGIKAVEPDDDDKRLVRHAALLHDIGHVIFSHVTENSFYSKRKNRALSY